MNLLFETVLRSHDIVPYVTVGPCSKQHDVTFEQSADAMDLVQTPPMAGWADHRNVSSLA